MKFHTKGPGPGRIGNFLKVERSLDEPFYFPRTSRTDCPIQYRAVLVPNHQSRK